MPRKYGTPPTRQSMSKVAGEARGSILKVKVGGPPFSGLLVQAVAVICTVPPLIRRHRPSIDGAVDSAGQVVPAGGQDQAAPARSSVREVEERVIGPKDER